MAEQGELSPDELEAIIEEVNEAERRNINILGSQLKPSILKYHPGKPSVGPLPRYIPTKRSKISEPPIVFGPAERIKPIKRDRLSRAKRELAFIVSLIETEGPTELHTKNKQKLIVEIREIRKLKHYKRKINRNKQ